MKYKTVCCAILGDNRSSNCRINVRFDFFFIYKSNAG